MGKKPRQYPEEFKRAAVRRFTRERIPATQLARELGIALPTLYEWKNRFSDDAAVDLSTTHSTDDELKRLRQENARLREDNIILKKYAAYITKESR